MYKEYHCFPELAKKKRCLEEMDLEGKKRVKKQTPAVWDHVLFGLGGSGTGRNVDSPCVTEKYFFQRRLFFFSFFFLKEWVIIVGQLKPFK